MIISVPGTSQQATYYSLLVAVAGGYVYIGTSPPSSLIARAGGQTTPPLNPNVRVSLAFLNGFVYIVDGSANIIAVNMTTQSVVPYAATAGSAPTFCSLCANWRGRLWLGGDANNPQDFYLARTGVPTDWDYSQTDPAAAVASENSESGLIGEPVTSLIPYTDDYAIVGCTHSMWMMQGDPADGGTMTRVSEAIGVVGKDAWCVDPAGTLYFTASGGLYSVRPIWEFYQPPQLLSGQSFNQFFQGLSWGDSFVYMVWDPDLHYMHLFVTPSGQAQGTHLTLDGRSIAQDSPGGLWQQQFPASMGPTAACEWFADSSANARTILLGGWDGYIRAFDEAALDDDGTPIQATVTLGPFRPFPEAGMWSGTTIDFGETTAADTQASPMLVTGETPLGAINGTNAVFTLANLPIESTLELFLNGVQQDSVSQYALSNLTATFVTPPASGSILLANYSYLGSPPTPWNATVTLTSGPDAFEVTEGSPHTSVTIPCILDRRQKTFRQRLRGGWFSLTVANAQPSSYFSIESAILEFMESGRNRERR